MLVDVGPIVSRRDPGKGRPRTGTTGGDDIRLRRERDRTELWRGGSGGRPRRHGRATRVISVKKLHRLTDANLHIRRSSAGGADGGGLCAMHCDKAEDRRPKKPSRYPVHGPATCYYARLYIYETARSQRLFRLAIVSLLGFFHTARVSERRLLADLLAKCHLPEGSRFLLDCITS